MAGYQKRRADWKAYPDLSTPIQDTDLDYLEQAIYDLKYLVFNVKDYGAVGDGITDDRAYIQAAIDAATAAGGGEVYFPRGNYLIGTPGLTLTTNIQTPITFRGSSGFGSDGTRTVARLVRNGTHSILDIEGTGQTITTYNHGFSAYELSIDGGGFGGSALFRLNRAGHFYLQRIYFKNSLSYGVWGTQLWNCWFVACRWAGCGTGGVAGTPALLMDNAADVGSGCNTVHFIACEWEANGGTDVRSAGISGNQNSTLYFVGCKWERSSGYAMYLTFTNTCNITGGSMYTNAANECLYVDSGSKISVANVNFSSGSTSTAPYLIHFNAGSGSVIGCSFDVFAQITTPATAHIGIASAVGTVYLNSNIFIPVSGGATPAYNDLRVTPTGIYASDKQLFAEAGFRTRRISLTYGATIATDASAGRLFAITATDANPFTISAPTNSIRGMEIYYHIVNSAGGVMGATTFDPVFFLNGAFTSPANTKRRVIGFFYDGANWVEMYRSSAVGDTNTVATKTTAYTITTSDNFIIADATSTAFTITLPTAVGVAGRQYRIKRINSNTNAVTVNTTSSQTIDGATSFIIGTPQAALSVISDGANWQIV